MAKEKAIECEGLIIEALPNSLFKVEIQNGHIVMCQISGKIRINNIRLLVGDRVKIEMSPYDLTKGRIAFRLK